MNATADNTFGQIDTMAQYRVRIYFWLALAGVVLFLPFAINDFVEGQSAMGFSTLTIVLILTINAISIQRGRLPLVPPALLFIITLFSLALSIRTQGLVSLFWCYPAIILFHFVLDRKVANLSNAALILVLTPISAIYIGAEITTRFFATAVSLVVFNNIFSHIVEGLQAQLYALTIVDPLTGAFNRRHLDASLEQAKIRQQRHQQAATVISVDIDHFKRINDQQGHPAGDRVLKALVASLTTRLRKTDLVFRAGGDEIVLLLPDTDLALACVLATEIKTMVEASTFLENYAVTVSMGVAELRTNEDVPQWMKRSDVALYNAKHRGRNCFVSAAETMSMAA